MCLPSPVPNMKTDNCLTQEMEVPPGTWTFSLRRQTTPIEEPRTIVQCAGIQSGQDPPVAKKTTLF